MSTRYPILSKIFIFLFISLHRVCRCICFVFKLLIYPSLSCLSTILSFCQDIYPPISLLICLIICIYLRVCLSTSVSACCLSLSILPVSITLSLLSLYLRLPFYHATDRPDCLSVFLSVTIIFMLNSQHAYVSVYPLFVCLCVCLSTSSHFLLSSSLHISV